MYGWSQRRRGSAASSDDSSAYLTNSRRSGRVDTYHSFFHTHDPKLHGVVWVEVIAVILPLF